MAGFMIAAAHKSSGKTVIATGLAAALTHAGKTVQCFKKGPDYIDPMWHAAASGRACYNLDFNTMSKDEITSLVGEKSNTAELTICEANKGLFDGVDTKGTDSNAEIAKLLGLPVILVIDTNGMTRGIAPLLMGYQAFDRDVNIAGVILNRVGGPRHETKLRAAVAAYTDLPVLGAVWRNDALSIDERHLGLSTPAENLALDKCLCSARDAVGSAVDLEALLSIAGGWEAPKAPASATVDPRYDGLTIAVARDPAFGFYYPDDLATFEAQGVRLAYFDTMNDRELPQADGLFIGGGFPELHLPELAANKAIRSDIRENIKAGLPTYAECGGLMYLCKEIVWNGSAQPMCGVIQATAQMHKRPQGRGYLRFVPGNNHPWNLPATEVRAHEFHYASLEELPDDTEMAVNLTRGHGIDGKRDGITKHNLLAGFAHQRHTAANPWIFGFLDFVARVNSEKK